MEGPNKGPNKGPLNWLRAAVGFAAVSAAAPAAAQEAEIQNIAFSPSRAERVEPTMPTPLADVAAFDADVGAFVDDQASQDIVNRFSSASSFASAEGQAPIGVAKPSTPDSRIERVADRFSEDNPITLPIVDRTDAGLRTNARIGVVEAAGDDVAGIDIRITN